MAVTLTVNGSSFSYPSLETDTFWGAAATGWAQAVTNGMLQKAGGSFTLTANVDFGASFGLKSLHFSSRTSNPSSAGLIRLANVDTFGFRNAANSADLLFSINPANDHLLFNGIDLSASSSSGNVVGPVSSTDNALVRFDGITGQIIQNSSVVVSDAGEITGVTTINAAGTTTFGATVATGTAAANALTSATTAVLGTGVSTTTTPDMTINANTGDATIRLQVNNAAANAWDIRNDNSDADAYCLEYNAIQRYNFKATGLTAIKFDSTNISSSSTPVSNTIYPNTLIKAWANTTSAGVILDANNLTCSSGSTGQYTYTFKVPMASTNYAVIVTVEDTATGYIASVATTTFSGKTVNSFLVNVVTNSNAFVNARHSVMVIGQQ